MRKMARNKKGKSSQAAGAGKPIGAPGPVEPVAAAPTAVPLPETGPFCRKWDWLAFYVATLV